MPFPNNRGIAVGCKTFTGVFERCVPTPGIGAYDPHPALKQIQSGFTANSDAGIEVTRLTKYRPGTGIDQHDIQRLQLMANSRQLGFDLVGGHHMTVRHVPKVQLHPRLQAPIQRQLIDAKGRLTAIGGRGVMPGCIHVRAAVGGDVQSFGGPGFVARHLFELQAGEHRCHFRPALLVIHVIDLRQQRWRIGVGVVVEGDREVDEATFWLSWLRHERCLRSAENVWDSKG
ncbi:hypothetical protein D3C81_985460 [compost metagenome]